MAVQIRLPKWTRMMLLVLSFVLFARCGIGGAEKENAEVPTVMAGASEAPEDGIANLPEQPQTAKDHELDETELQSEEHIALEQFGAYLEYLLKEGTLQELHQYVISRTLTWNEAAAMAELSPAFAHFSSYKECRFDSCGVILVEADVNGDGLKELIEYLPDVGDDNIDVYPDQYSLTIYKNQGELGYEVMYFQPYFDTMIQYHDQITVLQFNGRIYFMFTQNKYPNGEGQIITIYQLQDGAMTARLVIDYKYTDMDFEVLYCKSGMEDRAKELCEGAMDYWTADPKAIREQLFAGDAEGILSKESEEYAALERIGREEAEGYLYRYRELTGNKSLSVGYATGSNSVIACQSDLDNDGIPELYAQHTTYLGIRCGFKAVIYLTGELYGNGKHEGEWGLIYSLENGGQRTDFEQLCGLDIWSSDDIPQAFWVEPCGEENITFFKFFDQNYFTCLIEGYCIREGSYETVLSVRYRPIVFCETVYEWHEDAENDDVLSYTVHLPIDKENQYQYPVLYGLENEELQDNINDTIATVLQEKVSTFVGGEDGQGNQVWSGASCRVLSAEKGRLVLKYAVCNRYEGWQIGWGKYLCLEINLGSGEVLYSDWQEFNHLEYEPWEYEDGYIYRIDPTW